MGTKAQNRERRHESLHDVGVFCTRRRAAVMSPQSVVDFSYISAGSCRLRDNSRKGCTEQMDMQKSKAINWTRRAVPNDLSVVDGWEQYRRWLPKAPFPRERRGGIDPSLYTLNGYRNWTQQVKRNWSEE